MAKLWKQVRVVTVGELVFDYEDIDVEFDVKCTDDNKSDIATIKIYNLSETTKNKIQANQIVNIDAGYRELHQSIFGGLVENIRTYRDGILFSNCFNISLALIPALNWTFTAVFV